VIALSRQTDYACRIILHLALLPQGSRITAQDVAKKRIIPRFLIRRIVTRLAKAHLLATTRGNGGGLVLAKPSDQISLLDVVQAMEGPLALNACTLNPKTCPLMKACSVHEEWVRAREMLVAELSQARFDRLAQRGKHLGA
jgi:Rrf2 family protein